MHSEQHIKYMHRCLQLARLGAGNVAPNPMVGSVLVFEDRIIGEGYHRQYGQAHAEVNCLHSVKEEDRHLIPQSTIFVSLEPCAHFGKTPPCADLLIQHQIPRVVVGCRDPFPEVNGKGIEKLQAAGIEVISGVLEKECRELNKRFFTFHTQYRPYVVLKWAQTLDGKIAGLQYGPTLAPLNSGHQSPHPNPPPIGEGTANAQPQAPSNSPNRGETNAQTQRKEKTETDKAIPTSKALWDGKAPSIGGGLGEAIGIEQAARLLISNAYTNRMVHRWRSEETAILVGTHTALKDDPALTTRLWPGKNPVRLVVDMDLRLPATLKLFQGEAPTLVFNTKKHDLAENTFQRDAAGKFATGYYQVTEDVSLVHQMMHALYQLKIQSVLVEGGAFLLQSFINEGMWDEARIITNEQLITGHGLPAPLLHEYQLVKTERFYADMVRTFIPKNKFK